MFKNNQGFTLIEMLIVLMIITVLIILIIPNLSSRSKEVNDKGCEALATVVQAQVDAYHLDTNTFPTSLNSLANTDYLNSDQIKCKNGKELSYNEGKVSIPK